jgi:uncharacterized protein YpuA (DUF1002 family)
MKNCHTRLKELIEEVVLPDIEEEIDNIYEVIAKDKNSNDEQSNTLNELHEMRDEFKEVLAEIENRSLGKDECIELYEEIEAMLQGDEEE